MKMENAVGKDNFRKRGIILAHSSIVQLIMSSHVGRIAMQLFLSNLPQEANCLLVHSKQNDDC